jgi:hypothetical protein
LNIVVYIGRHGKGNAERGSRFGGFHNAENGNGILIV